MAISTRVWILYALLIFLCLSLLIDHVAEARGGGRGGGRSGGRGGGRIGTSRNSRTSYRGTRSTYRGTRSTYRGGNRYGGLHFQAAVAAGYIYGYSVYTRRSRFRRAPKAEPSICRNTVDYIMSNGTHWEFFVCPRASDPDSHTYCCGPTKRQHCCSFWQDGGRVAGTIFGILFFASIIGIVIYCCCRKRPRSKGEVLMLGTHTSKGNYTLANTIPPHEAMPPHKPPGSEYDGINPPMYPSQPYPMSNGTYPPDGGMPPVGQPGMGPPLGMPMPGDGMPPMYALEPGMPTPESNSAPYPVQPSSTPYPISPTPYPTNPNAYPSDPTPYPAGPGYPAGLPPPGYRETAEYPDGPPPSGPPPGYPTAPANV